MTTHGGCAYGTPKKYSSEPFLTPVTVAWSSLTEGPLSASEIAECFHPVHSSTDVNRVWMVKGTMVDVVYKAD